MRIKIRNYRLRHHNYYRDYLTNQHTGLSNLKGAWQRNGNYCEKHLARPRFDPIATKEIRLGFNHSTTNSPTIYGNATFIST